MAKPQVQRWTACITPPVVPVESSFVAAFEAGETSRTKHRDSRRGHRTPCWAPTPDRPFTSRLARVAAELGAPGSRDRGSPPTAPTGAPASLVLNHASGPDHRTAARRRGQGRAAQLKRRCRDGGESDDTLALARLRPYNLAAGLLHLGQAVVILVLANSFSLPVRATYITGPPGPFVGHKAVTLLASASPVPSRPSSSCPPWPISP